MKQSGYLSVLCGFYGSPSPFWLLLFLLLFSARLSHVHFVTQYPFSFCFFFFYFSISYLKLQVSENRYIAQYNIQLPKNTVILLSKCPLCPLFVKKNETKKNMLTRALQIQMQLAFEE